MIIIFVEEQLTLLPFAELPQPASLPTLDDEHLSRLEVLEYDVEFDPFLSP